jgi:hypothetical protein
MIIESPELVKLGRSGAHSFLGALNVFTILPASRIGAVSRSNKGKCTPNAILPHLSKGFRQKRMPVAVSPIDRQPGTVSFQLSLQSRDQSAILCVDGTYAAEQFVVVRDFLHS